MRFSSGSFLPFFIRVIATALLTVVVLLGTGMVRSIRGAESALDQTQDDDSLLRRFDEDGFNALDSGQPGTPGEVKAQFATSWLDQVEAANAFAMDFEISHTPSQTDFLKNTKIAVSLPVVVSTERTRVESLRFYFLQRWLELPRAELTVSTALTFLPGALGESDESFLELNGIFAKSFFDGVGYLNLFLNSTDVEPQLNYDWGAIAGYKQPLSQNTNLILDFVRDAVVDQSYSRVELSADYKVTKDITLGTGIGFGLSTPAGLNRWTIGALAVFVLK